MALPSMKGEQPIRVAIGVPMEDGMTNCGMVDWMGVCAIWGMKQKPRYEFTLVTANFVQPVAYARNQIVRDFLRTKADYLWFMDSDAIPRVNTLDIFQVDADLVCARAHAYVDDMEKGKTGVKISAYLEEEGTGLFVPIQPKQGEPAVQDIDAAGTHCLLIKRRVLEDRRLWLPSKYVDILGRERDLDDEREQKDWAPPLFRTQHAPHGKVLRGEDIDFTYRAKQLGYSLKVHLLAEVGHFKMLDVDGVERAARQALIRYGEKYANELIRKREEAPDERAAQAV